MSKEINLAEPISPSRCMNALEQAIQANQPVFLWGPPGIGKSDIVHQLAQRLKTKDGKHARVKVVDVRLSLFDPTDLKGLPYFNTVTQQMMWGQPVDLPTAEDGTEYDYVLLFLDEMNQAAPAVQAAAYQLVLNRKVGTYSLPENCRIIAAGNRESDKGVVSRMPTPLVSRFTHLEMGVSYDDWAEWAFDNNIHPDVLGYLHQNKGDLMTFNAKSAERTYCCPRTWAMVSRYLTTGHASDTVLRDLIEGTIGAGAATKFLALRAISKQLPNPEDVLSGKVDKLHTKDISAQYASITALAYELKAVSEKGNDDVLYSSVNNFISFAMASFESELQVVAVQQVLQRKIKFDPSKVPPMKEFIKANGKFVAAAAARTR